MTRERPKHLNSNIKSGRHSNVSKSRPTHRPAFECVQEQAHAQAGIQMCQEQAHAQAWARPEL